MRKILLIAFVLLILLGCSTKEEYNIEKCQKIINQEKPAAAECYFKTAMTLKNYTICEYIKGELNTRIRIQCYNDVAAMLRDETVCDHMKVENYSYLDFAKQQCKVYVSMR